MTRKTMMLSTAVLVGMIGFGAAVTLGFGSTAAVKSDPRQGPQLVQTALAKPNAGIARAFTGVIAARGQSNLGFRVPV